MEFDTDTKDNNEDVDIENRTNVIEIKIEQKKQSQTQMKTINLMKNQCLKYTHLFLKYFNKRCNTSIKLKLDLLELILKKFITNSDKKKLN